MCGSNSGDSWWAEVTAKVKRERAAETAAAERLSAEYGSIESREPVKSST